MKTLFSENNVKFAAVELDSVEGGAEMQEILAEKTGQRTVPNVFINGEHIGGSDATHKLHESGVLLKKISAKRPPVEGGYKVDL